MSGGWEWGTAGKGRIRVSGEGKGDAELFFQGDVGGTLVACNLDAVGLCKRGSYRDPEKSSVRVKADSMVLPSFFVRNNGDIRTHF